MKKGTLKYIAKELNISVSTVSRALNNKNIVKDETRKKVLELADKYSYTPNEIARSLRKSSTDTIAIVLPDISETFFGNVVNEIDKEISDKGYMILLADTHEEIEKEQKYLDMLYKRRVDALVLATVDFECSAVQRFLDNDVPVVFIDNIPNIKNINLVVTDNKKASRMAIEYLHSQGHRDVAAIIGSEKESTGLERLNGYVMIQKELNMKPNANLVKYGDFKYMSGKECMNELLKNRDKNFFSAVYITSEKMTHGAVDAILESGLKIPEDISVVGFDVHDYNQRSSLKITSIKQKEEEIGKKVGNLLLKCLKSKKNEDVLISENIVLEPYIEYGGSVKEIVGR